VLRSDHRIISCANNIFGSFSVYKKIGTGGSKVKNEYRIQDRGCPGAGIPNILAEKTFYTKIRTPDISATTFQRGRTAKTVLYDAG
jgi:hypothetical protein